MISDLENSLVRIFVQFKEKLCNRPLTEILTWVPISHCLTDFNRLLTDLF